MDKYGWWGRHSVFEGDPRLIWIGPMSEDEMMAEYPGFRHNYRSQPVKDANGESRERERNREYVQNYLATHNCADCGEADPAILGFDYPRGGKNLNISYMVERPYPPEDVEAEIDRSVVRCANCHFRANRGGITCPG